MVNIFPVDKVGLYINLANASFPYYLIDII